MRKPPVNLNELTILEDTASGYVARPQKDHSMTKGAISVHFKRLPEALVNYIRAADAVIGCVAWLSNTEIIDALSEKRCCILVQKEDFLRPDTGANPSGYKSILRERYSRLKATLYRYELPGIAPQLNVSSMDPVEPIRCVGMLNTKRQPAFPRCHHKFVVFCAYHDAAYDAPEPWTYVKPYAVWTGSFNFTENSNNSLENAVYIDDASIARAYANEFSQILALSESLDWMAEYHEPEFRIGT